MVISSDILAHGSTLAFPIVLAGGLLAGLNPCCVAMYPAATACCCVQSNSRDGFFANTFFVLGAASTTASLGIGATLLGKVVGQFDTTARYAIAFVPMLMAFFLAGWLKLPARQVPVKWAGSGPSTAFVTGALVALLISPCGTPILASVLSYVAFKGSLLFGMALLFTYGIGNSLPVALVGSAASAALNRSGNLQLHKWITYASGTILIATSFYLIWKV